jgi:hypothetical protein
MTRAISFFARVVWQFARVIFHFTSVISQMSRAIGDSEDVASNLIEAKPAFAVYPFQFNPFRGVEFPSPPIVEFVERAE